MARLMTVAGFTGCFLLTLAALSLLPREAAPLFVPPVSSPDYFPYMVQNGADFGPSLYSRRRVLSDCYDGIRRLYVAPQLLSAEDTQSFHGHCMTLAQKGAEQAPLDSYAWMVQARIHVENGNAAAFNQAYRQAFMRGPNEYWLVATRVSLAEIFLENLDDDSRQRHEADLMTMGFTQAGQRWLAHNYTTKPAFRERVTPVIERLPPIYQAQFLSKLRRSLNTYTQP